MIKSPEFLDENDWIAECIENPKEGVQRFLRLLCEISGSEYAHFRIISRTKNFYTMVDSVGPYKHIGWKKRFRFIDQKERNQLFYNVIFHENIADCKDLLEKYKNNPEFLSYLQSLKYAVWFPLQCNDIELGYFVLSWVNDKPTQTIIKDVKSFLSSINSYAFLLFSAARSTITNNTLDILFDAERMLITAEDEIDNYEDLAEACLKIWGAESTIYVGKVIDNLNVEIVTVKGKNSESALLNKSNHIISINNGLFGYTFLQKKITNSPHVSSDSRYRYYSLLDDEIPGSAICAPILESPDNTPIAIISIEHEMECFFDEDDVRCLKGLANVGYQAISTQKAHESKVAHRLNLLLTRLAHDFFDPTAALIADTQVLKYQCEILNKYLSGSKYEVLIDDIYIKSESAFEQSKVLLNKVKKCYDESDEDEGSIIINPRINLSIFLNKTIDSFTELAKNEGIEFKRSFKAFKYVFVKCDTTELHSALDNLLGNAIKYSFVGRRFFQNEGSKFQRFIRVNGTVENNYAIIEIQNFGIGILPDELKFVTRYHYRGKQAIKEGRAGTGRGLSDAEKFFKQAGGYLKIFSRPVSRDFPLDDSPYLTTVVCAIPIHGLGQENTEDEEE